MFKFWKKQNNNDNNQLEASITWDDQAKMAINQALAQAPVPAMLKGRVRKELEDAAINAAKAAGRTKVEAQDVMNGMLAKLPANMRQKVEDAMQKGPDGLKQLQNELKDHK